MPPSDILTHFHPLIAQWFTETLGEPTDVQQRAWTEVMQKRHVLVTAPTGSGKTLAAFLWAINQLVTGTWSRGETRVLYVSPLKALNNDVRRNLIAPLEELREYFKKNEVPFPSISVQTRSGDTPGNERRRMLRNPPEILITTPESLNILLTSKGSRSTLTGVATVILDEIHAVAGSKRGTHLITAVERLVLISGEFQRIALSATVRPLETVADFIGGFEAVGHQLRKRPVSIVRGERSKRFDLQITAPEETERGPDEDFWPALIRRFTGIIDRHKSTLFFANSRRTTEKVTRLINEETGEEVAYSHHGSLSREIRLAVEERLKRGELKAIVATNSLELGIDIGRLDSVVLIQTPRSISSAVQRIGRSGHGVGEVSSGLLFPTNGMDFVSAAVIARSIADGEIEELRPVEAPLDLLAQIILAMALPEQWHLDDLYEFLTTTYPYRNLSRQQFDLVVGMLEGKYADSRVMELRPRATVDRLEETISTRPALSMLIYMEGGTIPERGYYELRLKENGAKIGELDEEFVWERKLGDTFALGAQVWQIVEVTHSTVQVVAARKPQQIIPFWRAEELDRDFFYSDKIATFLEHCAESLDGDGFVREMTDHFFMDKGAAQSLRSFLKKQQEASGAELPHRHHLLVEHYHDPRAGHQAQQIILHTLWGNSLNRPFTFALSAAWEKRYGYALQAFYDNDGIALLLPHEMDVQEVLSPVAPENLETLLRASLEGTGYFGARFRENAGRALLLSRTNYKRRMPLWLNRLRSRKLLASILKYRDFPVLLETWRSSLQDDFDLANLKRLLEELQDGEIAVTEIRTTVATPFAKGLIWLQTNKYVYEDDTPYASQTSALGQDLLQELTFSPHLRPRLPGELIRIFVAKQQRTAPGYQPDSPRELIDWVKERLLIPQDEWLDLLHAMERDHQLDREELLSDVAERIALVQIPDTEVTLAAAIEMLPELAQGLARDWRELKLAALVDDPKVQERLQRAALKMAQAPSSAQSERPLPSRKSPHPTPLAEGEGADSALDEDDFAQDLPETAEEEGSATVRLVGKFLNYYGPLELPWLQQTLGLPDDLFHDVIHSLEETGQVVLDQFGEESRLPEICDAVNLESLLRMLRRSRKAPFEALELSYLPLFLATFQGVVRRGDSVDDLRSRLEQLLGTPLSAAAWEEEVLPARLQPYFNPWLDSLMQTSDLLWFGCGEKKLSFAFPEDLDLFLDPQESGEDPDGARIAELIADPKGRYTLPAIALATSLPAAKVTEQLWTLAWKGKLSNDSFAAVRKGILNRFTTREAEHRRDLRRMPVSTRWNRGQESAGSWYLIPRQETSPDILEREERNKDRVRVLLERYGFLFKELLLRELPPMQWGRLFRTLRIMELSGELLSGNFFAGIPGLQFISHQAFRLLEKGLPQDQVYWLNATDPASLCGSGLEGIREQLPARLPSTHLVYHGTRLVMVSKRYGKELEIKAQPDDPRLHEYLSIFNVLLTREFNPVKRITVDQINGAPAATSSYAEALKEFGFEEAYHGLELWRRY
ncbi:DEAD/DEAH box helicase [Geomonas sp.]|uniref:DEAD/DEAH box helicase n=1 Tax=Geomonas sp. TaxID=2651584 RepID=UPI002B484F03|nr:DEAD/DEAH box helicase [Geomonas sp.]HJV33694.1 DEAD/DEAH box helicase [Geomonas sp.]